MPIDQKWWPPPPHHNIKFYLIPELVHTDPGDLCPVGGEVDSLGFRQDFLFIDPVSHACNTQVLLDPVRIMLHHFW